MAMVLFIGAAMAQHQHMNNSSVPMGNVPQPEYFFMREEGKLLHVINGKENLMLEPLTLENGVMVHPDGTLHLKKGKEKKLRVGEAVDSEGKVYSSITVLLKKTLPQQSMPAESHGMQSGGGHAGHH